MNNMLDEYVRWIYVDEYIIWIYHMNMLDEYVDEYM